MCIGLLRMTSKSQIAHSDMHHPVCGLNSRIFSVSLASHISTHILIHLSAHPYYYHHSHHPSLLHSFTPGSKPTFSTNPSYLRLLLPTGLPSWQRDWTGPIMLIVLFSVSHLIFLFIPCGWLSWLHVSFLLHVKYTLSYRIVSIQTKYNKITKSINVLMRRLYHSLEWYTWV